MTAAQSQKRARVTMRDAVNAALVEEMDRDPSVVVIGEDVAGGGGMAAYEGRGSMGGVFGVTKGLVERFGRARVLDTPLSETAIMGLGVGAAMSGMRPVVELMFTDFLGTCLDPIYNQGAKVRFMSGGQASVPLVIRTAFGGGLSAGAQHSGCHYSVFAHFPGLKVVVPSSPADAHGLLTASIRDDDIVVFLEHKAMYGRSGPPAPAGHVIPLGRLDVKRKGSAVTVVGIGATVHTAADAAAELAKEGVDCEVLDLRSLVPLDVAGLAASLAKTRRLVVVDEDNPVCSMASEVVATVCTTMWDNLDAGPIMVTPPQSPVPFAPELEAAYQPGPGDVIAAVRRVLEGTRSEVRADAVPH